MRAYCEICYEHNVTKCSLVPLLEHHKSFDYKINALMRRKLIYRNFLMKIL